MVDRIVYSTWKWIVTNQVLSSMQPEYLHSLLLPVKNIWQFRSSNSLLLFLFPDLKLILDLGRFSVAVPSVYNTLPQNTHLSSPPSFLISPILFSASPFSPICWRLVTYRLGILRGFDTANFVDAPLSLDFLRIFVHTSFLYYHNYY